MILTADIGNTNITLGVFDGDELVCISRLATQRHRTSEQYAVELSSIFSLEKIDTESVNGAIISSVVPELTRVFKNAITKVTGCDALVVAAGIKNGLKIKTDNPKELGADLVAGAVGAINQYKLPCLVMDLGTATKISVIDEDGTFVGCTIAPGIGISLDALAMRTSQLPTIELCAPKNPINDTYDNYYAEQREMFDLLSKELPDSVSWTEDVSIGSGCIKVVRFTLNAEGEMRVMYFFEKSGNLYKILFESTAPDTILNDSVTFCMAITYKPYKYFLDTTTTAPDTTAATKA